MSKYQQNGLIPPAAHWASVKLQYRGARGDLVAINASHDPTFRYLLQSPFTDALSFSWRGGLWNVDATHNSLITTGNAGDKPARVKAILRHALGSFELPEKTLQSGEPMWLNVRELIQNQILDRNGNAIPATITSGVYEFDQVDDEMVGSLYEGKLILDSTFGHAAYGCANCCGQWAMGLVPDPLGVDVGFTSQDHIYVQNACTGAVTEKTSYGFSWGTGNSTIAGINSSGLVSGSSVGETSSFASINLRTPDVWNCPYAVQSVSNVVKVVTLSCTPPSVTRGQTVSCTLSGPTGTSCSSWRFTGGGNTVNGPSSGCAWSGSMVQGGTISVDASVSGGSPTTLTRTITVTPRNWHTNPAGAVQVPNGTFSLLPVPPQPSGGDSGLGYFDQMLV